MINEDNATSVPSTQPTILLVDILFYATKAPRYLGIRYKCPHPQCEYPAPTKSGLSVLSKDVHMKIR